ncbi:universal stress protein [Pseudonocardia nantongensis]|uniref:universal stress protein n=1 Tax=Pseudonocardia nantongensis TaxID=1181885 RepID=UPI00397D73C0
MAERHGGPVVVGVDGSESGSDAVRWAASEALGRGVGLRVVAVYTPLPRTRHTLGLESAYREQVTAALQTALDDAVRVATEAAPGIAVDRELRTGYPAPVLVAESDAATLTVVGSRGLGGFSGMLVGSVAVTLAARGGSPVLVVRGDRRPDSGLPVLLGVDGSPAGEAAIGPAFEWAARRAVPLRAVHAWLDVTVAPAAASLVDQEAWETEERALLAERLAGHPGEYPEVEVQRVVVRDRPARALIDGSADAGLVVVGSRGRGGVAGLLLGSVGQAVLHHAHCPVLVVRS